jgi:hypothetical protein
MIEIAPAPEQTSFVERTLRVLLFPLALAAPFLRPPAERKRHSRAPRSKAATSARKVSGASVAGLPPVSVRMVLMVPALAATLLVVAFVVLELLGRTPLAYEPPRNIAEAAGMGIPSEVLRFLRQGQNPEDVFEIRPDIISSEITRATALEAAIWSRRARLVRLLDRQHGIAEEQTRRHLACLASDIRAAQIVEYFAPQGIAGCEPGQARRVVEARSR